MPLFSFDVKTDTIHRKFFYWLSLTLSLFRSILGLTETFQHAFCVCICNKNTLRMVSEKNLSVSWILLQNINSKNTFGCWEKKTLEGYVLLITAVRRKLMLNIFLSALSNFFLLPGFKFQRENHL